VTRRRKKKARVNKIRIDQNDIIKETKESCHLYKKHVKIFSYNQNNQNV
jgi:hypothetical protein